MAVNSLKTAVILTRIRSFWDLLVPDMTTFWLDSSQCDNRPFFSATNVLIKTDPEMIIQAESTLKSIKHALTCLILKLYIYHTVYFNRKFHLTQFYNLTAFHENDPEYPDM